MLRNIKKKLEARPSAAKSAEERAIALYNDTPVTLAAENILIDRITTPDCERTQVVLKPHWDTAYDAAALMGVSAAAAAKVYLESLTWTLCYYSGGQVDMYWYYPWYLPPRHASIAAALEKATILHVPSSLRTPLKPVEQLAMVLPESSFTLLPAEYKRLLALYPV